MKDIGQGNFGQHAESFKRTERLIACALCLFLAARDASIATKSGLKLHLMLSGPLLQVRAVGELRGHELSRHKR